MLFPVEVEPSCGIAQSPPTPSPMMRREQVFLRTSHLSQAAECQKANQCLTSCVVLCIDEGTREREISVHVAQDRRRQCRLEKGSPADIFNEIYLGMPGDGLKLKIEGRCLVQSRESERPDTCRYVGTPCFGWTLEIGWKDAGFLLDVTLVV